MTVSDFGTMALGSRYARHVVGDAKALELALFVEVVDRFEGHLIWSAAIGPVEVPHVDRAVDATTATSAGGLWERRQPHTQPEAP